MDGSAITPFAWFFMLISMGAVTTLTTYCFYRILTGRGIAGRDAGPEPAAGAGSGPGSEAGRPEDSASPTR